MRSPGSGAARVGAGLSDATTSRAEMRIWVRDGAIAGVEKVDGWMNS